MTFSSNSTQFSVDGNLNVSGPASFNNAAVFANTITIQNQLIANGTSGTPGLLLLSGGSGNVYWAAANGFTSNFTNWQVNGTQVITAVGSDTLNIISGNNINITASNSSIKSLTINANINLANTTTTGIVQLIDSVTNTSITLAATANTVKNAYDRAIDANTRASSAQTAAGSAYSNAIAYSGNAALAYANAISTAAGDATTKAGTAYSNAIAYSGNAALAYANAIAYAASNTYVNNTFAPQSAPSFSGTSSFANVSITGNLTVSGPTTLQQSSEVLNLTLSPSSVVNYNFSTGSIWYNYGINGNWTANFTNMPTTDNRTLVCTLVIFQSSLPGLPTEVQIGGDAVQIYWLNGTLPTAGTVDTIDIVSLTFIRAFDGWEKVLGSVSSYEPVV